MVRIIIFFLVFYLIYYIVKTLFLKPFLQGYVNRSKGKDSRNPFRPEGEVTIISKPKNGKGNDHGMGDYIDYEEIKE